MAYSLITNDVVQIRTKAKLFNQTIRMVLHYVVTSTTSGNDAATELQGLITKCTDVGVGWFQSLLATQTNQITYQEMSAQVVYVTRRPPISQPLNITGSGVGSCIAPNMAAVVTKRTEISTAKKLGNKVGGQGSVHVAAIDSGSVVGGMLTAAFTGGAIGTFMTRLLNSYTTPGNTRFDPVLWHSKATQIHSTLLTSTLLQPEIRDMRRRTVGLGE